MFVWSFLFVAFIAVPSLWADNKLPNPAKTGGSGIFTLLEQRASGTRGSFPAGKISEEELSSILWAAMGRNRGGKGWTTPLAGGRNPYVKIYVFRPDGAYLYDGSSHTLKTVTEQNVMKEINNDGFVQASPAVLVFVSDPSDLGSMARLNGNNELAYTATGAMAQNVYLAADSLGISTRYIVSLNAGEIGSALGLKGGEVPLCILPLGKR